eukprot:symbB.v1.2.008182.t1/scaffold450.1/size202773/1
MKKLRTALNKLRVSLKNKQKASQESDNKIARTLAGRTSVAKSVNATDPLLLQSFKELMQQKEMRVIKDPAVELVNGTSDASRPFVIRKGRNVMKYLARQDEVRAVLERTVDSFRDKLLIILEKSEDGGVTQAVTESLCKNIPDSWAASGVEVLPKSKHMDSVLKENPDLEPAFQQMTSIWITGRKVETVYTGLDSQGLATLHAQVSGGRLVVLAAVDEVLAYFPAAKRCLKTALDMLTKLSVKELPDAFGMPSLCAQYIRTGDVIYCPCGYVAVEKCIQDTSVAAVDEAATAEVSATHEAPAEPSPTSANLGDQVELQAMKDPQDAKLEKDEDGSKKDNEQEQKDDEKMEKKPENDNDKENQVQVEEKTDKENVQEQEDKNIPQTTTQTQVVEVEDENDENEKDLEKDKDTAPEAPETVAVMGSQPEPEQGLGLKRDASPSGSESKKQRVSEGSEGDGNDEEAEEAELTEEANEEEEQELEEEEQQEEEKEEPEEQDASEAPSTPQTQLTQKAKAKASKAKGGKGEKKDKKKDAKDAKSPKKEKKQKKDAKEKKASPKKKTKKNQDQDAESEPKGAKRKSKAKEDEAQALSKAAVGTRTGTDLEAIQSFRKRAMPPTAEELKAAAEKKPKTNRFAGAEARHGSMKERESKDLKTFHNFAMRIFESLKKLEVVMDLEELIVKDGSIDEDRFFTHTCPNRASTGLRYARCMQTFLKWVLTIPECERKATPNAANVAKLRVVEYLEFVIQVGVGFSTPYTVLYALDFFAKAFGFSVEGNLWDRCRRLANRYSNLKPADVNRAPPFRKDFLAALERIVLDTTRTDAERVVCGKLRLCTQASVRYDDILHTPLSSCQWIRKRGETSVVGSRWYGAKSTFSSLMQHLSVDTKVVRLAGGWTSRDENMPDTYLREAQIMVLGAQEKVLDYIRKGGDLEKFESTPLDHPPKKGETSYTGEQKEAPVVEAMEPFSGKHHSRCREELLDEAFDSGGRPNFEKVQLEANIKIELDKLDELVGQAAEPLEMVPEIPKFSPTDEDSDAPTSPAELEDAEGLVSSFVMVDRPTTISKLHLGKETLSAVHGYVMLAAPKCGAVGSFAVVGAGEKIDEETELCARICGATTVCTGPHRCDLPVTFHKSAVRFDVAESDYLLLQSLGIATANSFAFRVPKADDLETFLQEKLLNACAYKNEDGVILTFNKNPPDRWVDWKLSEDAAALRRLWQFSREVAKSEVEKMVGGEDTSKKIGITEMMAMESSAVDRGMPHPSSDRQRPSLYTMNRVAKALQSPGATYEIVAWECFISREEEERLVRAGKMPKAKQTELVLGKDSTVLAKDKHSDYVPDVKVGDMEKLREALDLRARSMELLDLARFNTVRALNDAYLAELTKTVPSGMRVPTLNELRRLDREIFLEMGRHLSRGRGTLEDAIRFYADHKDAMIWRLVEPVPASLPDQGIDLGDQ